MLFLFAILILEKLVNTVHTGLCYVLRTMVLVLILNLVYLHMPRKQHYETFNLKIKSLKIIVILASHSFVDGCSTCNRETNPRLLKDRSCRGSLVVALSCVECSETLEPRTAFVGDY